MPVPVGPLGPIRVKRSALADFPRLLPDQAGLDPASIWELAALDQPPDHRPSTIGAPVVRDRGGLPAPFGRGAAFGDPTFVAATSLSNPSFIHLDAVQTNWCRDLEAMGQLTQMFLEATPRIELGMEVLQTSALPLGYVAS